MLVKESFTCIYRGKIHAKNKGEIDMYFVYSNNTKNLAEKRYDKFERDLSNMLVENLDERLHYHGYHHTLYVLKVAEEIGLYEKISEDDMVLLKTAVLLHDSGFINTYKDHEEEGCRIAQEWLPKYGYRQDEIDRIKGMIMATKIPQTPHNLLEYIIADADLEYLGTDTFEATSETLYQEWTAFDMISGHDAWMKAQRGFISKHSYFTEYCKKFRTEKKLENLASIQEV